MLQKKLIDIAKCAGDEIMKYYKSPDLFVETKSDSSPVTHADLNAHRVICEGLQKISNEIIISEESDLNKTKSLQNKKFWLVDPLDGTRDFIAGNDSFCVSIALIDGSSPIVGILYSPVLNEIFFAQRNEGSYLNGVKLYNSSKRKQLFGLASGALKVSERMKEFLNISKIEKLTRYGSALKFGHLARGDADIYPRFGETSEWDTAAGQLICEEAGCEVFDIVTLKTLEYGKPQFRNSGFVAIRSDLVQNVRGIVENLRSKYTQQT